MPFKNTLIEGDSMRNSRLPDKKNSYLQHHVIQNLPTVASRNRTQL